MFGVEIASVGGAWLPVEVELVVCLAVLEPVVAHVHTFGFLGLASAVYYAVCGFIVNAYGCWWLRVAELFECVSDGDGLLCVQEECSEFGLGGG